MTLVGRYGSTRSAGEAGEMWRVNTVKLGAGKPKQERFNERAVEVPAAGAARKWFVGAENPPEQGRLQC